MTELSATAIANAAGVAVVTYNHNKGGIWQILWQTTVETNPVVGTARATVRRNGRYISSTLSGSGASAQGQPALKLEASDVLTVTWVGLTAGTQGIALFLFEEVPAGSIGSTFGLV